MTEEARRLAVRQEWAKAQRALEAGRRNAAAGDRDTATNRLYFAALHAAKAVLLTEGIEARRHRSAGRLLVVHFIAKGTLPDWVEPALARLETERDLADYAADYEVTSGRYEKCDEQASSLMEELERYLREHNWLP